MFNAEKPSLSELPSSGQLLKSTIIAAVSAVVILVTVVLPAEYGIDPTGVGKAIGLAEMGEIKTQLAEEAEADRGPAPGSARRDRGGTRRSARHPGSHRSRREQGHRDDRIRHRRRPQPDPRRTRAARLPVAGARRVERRGAVLLADALVGSGRFGEPRIDPAQVVASCLERLGKQ